MTQGYGFRFHVGHLVKWCHWGIGCQRVRGMTAEVRGVVLIGKIPGSMELGRIEGLIIQAGTIDRI